MRVYSILSKSEDPAATEAPSGSSGIAERPGIPRIIMKPAARLLSAMTSQNVPAKPIIGVESVTGKEIL